MQLNQFNQNLYILSAYRKYGAPGINRDNHEGLKKSLRAQDVRFIECEGSYQGEKEQSLILTNTHKILAHHFASLYYQDCFLKLKPHKDNMFKAYVVDTETGDENFAGYFRSFGKETIEDLSLDYTKDAAGTYFSIWHTDTPCVPAVECEINRELIKRMEKYNAV